MDENTRLIWRMTFAVNKIDGVYYMLSKKLGVNENTLALFYALNDGKTHSQSEIADNWMIPRTTVNSTVNALIKDGIISLSPPRHGKEKDIILTEKGKAYAEKLFSGIYEAERHAIKSTVNKYSDKFIDALEFFANDFCLYFNENKKEEN